MENLAKRQANKLLLWQNLYMKELKKIKIKNKKTLNKVGKAKYVLLQWYALSNNMEANEMFHYGDTPTCEGNPR